MANATSSTKINARIDPQIKQKAQQQLKRHGLTLSEFIRMILTTVANDGLPKYYGLPNKKVMASLDEVIADLSGKKKLKGAKNINELNKLLDK